MAYNTGNPIGSLDPRDAADNKENFDRFALSTARTYTDRLGVPRKTLAGMEQDFQQFLINSGYQFLGDYAAGIEVTAYNQVIRDGGEFWRVSAGTSLPYMTTGAGIPEGVAFVSVGDAVLRQDLADPDKGAAMLARGVVAVDSIADLLALPPEVLRSDLRYEVKGFHAGSTVGGGTFFWEGTSSAEDNGGTIHKAYTGYFVLSKDQTVTPYHFGIIDGELAGDSLQAFFDEMCSTDSYRFDMSARVNINRSYDLVSSIVDRVITGIMDLMVVDALPLRYVLKIDVNFTEWLGGFKISALHYDLFDVGIQADRIGRGGFRHISVQRANGFGLQFSGVGNNNMASVDKLIGFQCGLVESPFSATFVSHTGAQNSATRRANFVASFTERQKRSLLSSPVIESSIVSINDTPHIIKSYDHDTGAMEIYPGMPDGFDYAGAVLTITSGGMLCTFGGDGGQLRVGVMDARAVGVAWRSAALFGSSVEQLIAQSCGASYVNGIGPTSIGGFGDNIGHIYQENVKFRCIATSTAGTCSIASSAEAPIEAWQLQPPIYPPSAGAGNRRFRLLGNKSQFNGGQDRYEKYLPSPEAITTSATSDAGITDVLLPISMGSMVFVDSPDTEARAIVVISSLETSVAGRHSSVVLLSNNYGTGGATFSVVVINGRDYLRITHGTTDLSSATWRVTETPLVSQAFPAFT